MNNQKKFTTCLNKDCADIIELIDGHMRDYYEKELALDELVEIFWSICEGNKFHEAIYDAAQEYAKEKGWEMT